MATLKSTSRQVIAGIFPLISKFPTEIRGFKVLTQLEDKVPLDGDIPPPRINRARVVQLFVAAKQHNEFVHAFGFGVLVSTRGALVSIRSSV